MALRSFRKTEGSRSEIRPRGRHTIIATMARPKRSRRYSFGSKPWPKIALQEAEVAQEFGAADHRDRRDGDAELRAHAAEHHDGQDDRRFEEVEALRQMKPCRTAKNEPAKPPNMAPIAKAVSLVLVVLMPSERQAISSSRSASQARPMGSLRRRKRDEVGDERQRQDQVVEEDDAVHRVEREPEGRGEAVFVGVEGEAEEADARDRGDAGAAVREVDPVDENEADDLAEGERHDGEVVAPQPQHGEAEHDAPEGGENTGDGQANPERQAEGGRKRA